MAIRLTETIIGLTNMQHDQVMRRQIIDIDNQDVDRLYEAKLGNSYRVAPDVLGDVSSRAGGLTMRPEGYSSIEDGWAASRGLCKMTFEVSNTVSVVEKLVVLGYLSGGDVAYDDLPTALLFTPVRQWVIEEKSAMNHNMYMESRKHVTSSSQFLMDDANTQGLQTIRPRDILEGVIGMQAESDEAGMIAGGDEGEYAGSSASNLRVSGATLSRADNAVPSEYAEKIIGSSMQSGERSFNGLGRYNALADSIRSEAVTESAFRQDPFIDAMRRGLGNNEYGTTGFTGYTIGEIIYVFDNFTDTLNMSVVNDNRFSVADNRLDNEMMGTASFSETVATELAFIAQYILIRNDLTYLEISGSNNVDGGSYNLNNMPVDFFAGAMMPIEPEMDLDLQGTLMNVQEDLIRLFFKKYSAQYLHERTLINFNAKMSLFGDTVIELAINGDDENIVKRSFPTFGSNRFDPVLVQRQEAFQSVKGYYQNLTEHFNF